LVGVVQYGGEMSNSHIKLGDALPEKLLVSHVRLMGFDLSVPKIVSICELTC